MAAQTQAQAGPEPKTEPASQIVSDVPRSQAERPPSAQYQQYSGYSTAHQPPAQTYTALSQAQPPQAQSQRPVPAQTKFTIYTPTPPQPGAPPAHQHRPNIDHNAAMRRPVIMDPPRRPPVSPPMDGFASPENDHARENPRFLEDHHRLAFAIDQATPSAVRRVIRDYWEKCLLGSEFHQAFVTNATIHHVTPAIFQRAVRDFGNKMVSFGKRELIEHYSMHDFDELADFILNKAGSRFLDKAMAIRLRTIEAKPLINALARAERLGYEPSDVVEEVPNTNISGVYQPGHERVLPGQQQPGQVPGFPTTSAPHPGTAVMQGPGELRCSMCSFSFPGPAAMEHHMKKAVCSRTAKSPGGFKFSCQYCGQGFSTIVGLQYHTANKVCGDYGQNAKEAGTRNNPMTISSGNSTPVHAMPEQPRFPSGSTTGYKEWSMAQRMAEKGQVTPAPPPSQPSYDARATIPFSTPSGTPGDPYAHLSAAQLAAMKEELRQAEIKYGDKLRQARALPDQAERKTRIDALSNSYGTKQSMIRKKYGVRLRSRRTKAEIEAEKERISTSRTASPSKAAFQSMNTPTPAAGEKRPQSGWTAANVSTPPNDYANGHDTKRQRVVAEEALHFTTPSQPAAIAIDTPSKVPVPGPSMSTPAASSSQDVSMGGVAASARNSASLPAPSSHTSRSHEVPSPPPGASATAPLVPEHATDSNAAASAETPPPVVNPESTDSDSNDDIPAALPPSVRQSLPAQPPPRPGSRPSSS